MAAAAAALLDSVSVAAAFVGGGDDEQGAAVREVAQVYELIKTQQPLLLLLHDQRLAHTLLTEALRALNVALSVMKRPCYPPPPPAAASAGGGVMSNSIKADTEASLHLSSSASSPANSATPATPPADLGDNHVRTKARKAAAKRRRSYFRCTYKDDKGCPATKQIQQKDNNYPPMFQVTYTKEHTCSFCTTTTRTVLDDNTSRNNNNPTSAGTIPDGGRPDSDDDAMIWSNDDKKTMSKQEPQAINQLAAAAVIPDNPDETPAFYVCQEAAPLGNNTDTVCTGGSASVSGCTTDELDHQVGRQPQVETTTTTVLEEALEVGAELDYPCFSDIHLDLLLQYYDNFNPY
ncbi:hypothetical protein GUJ93_ZPchr0011g28152 [Zizania palustris]|uniref:WRKY domain-containing protein n=1 Tax=Zizania palustris TaxID=103762 RepID=A0A8J6BJJ0_ZIZPA|nr:hypothetical protein GUJ93_ZPchr0011g28152 [Zizania palustris]